MDCSECGLLFETNDTLIVHNKEYHTWKLFNVEVEEPKGDEEAFIIESDEESEEFYDLAFYDIEYTPKVSTEEEISGISFKGESEEFQLAHKTIEK